MNKYFAETKFWPDKKVIISYLILPKPGIVALALLATMTGLYLGAHGRPDSEIVLWTLLGMGFATAGAATLNNFLDKDIDYIMQRTRQRSLPSGFISPKQAYIVGTFLVLTSLCILKIFVSDLVTLLTGIAIFTYVVLYSLYLKRSTPFATHIGGIAGALPPLIGYVASRGELDKHAFILFLIIVVWQQPHFWVLALKYKDDYAKAGVPILPVAKGVWATKVRLFWYTLALLPVSFLPYFYHLSGFYYLITAIVMGVLYLAFTVRFVLSSKVMEMFLFFFSIFYLSVIFIVMLVDMV